MNRPDGDEASQDNWVVRLWKRYVTGPLTNQERESREAIAAHPEERIDWALIGAFVLVAISLILLEYFGKNQYYWEAVHPREVSSTALDLLRTRFASDPGAAPINWYSIDALREAPMRASGPDTQLLQLLYWVGWCVVTYFVLPALYLRFVMKKRLRDMGLNFDGFLSHLWVYVLMFAVVLPLVWYVSRDPGFQMQYPFYRYAAEDPDGFWIWELGYAAQFFSLEFFFRGFMVHGFKDRFGAYAVLVMMIPYVMIHFGKPMPETFGAIIAGLVLGVLSLRTGSIILGFLIHVSVALSMDLVSVWRQGALGNLF